MNDKKLGKYLILLLFFPLALAMCSGDRYRYPCQDPANWDKELCQKPLCEVNRTCPDLIFKNQSPAPKQAVPYTGVNCR